MQESVERIGSTQAAKPWLAPDKINSRTGSYFFFAAAASQDAQPVAAGAECLPQQLAVAVKNAALPIPSHVLHDAAACFA
jgi:hypothetical protein